MPNEPSAIVLRDDGVSYGDSLASDPGERFDCVMTNPPLRKGKQHHFRERRGVKVNLLLFDRKSARETP